MKKKKVNPKESMNVKLVVKDIEKAIRKGQKINIGKLMRERGYTKSVSLKPGKVTRTKTFKRKVAPLVERMMVQRDLAIARMGKTIKRTKYRDAVAGVDLLTKNIQLISGKVTSRVTIADLLDGIEKKNG